MTFIMEYQKDNFINTVPYLLKHCHKIDVGADVMIFYCKKGLYPNYKDFYVSRLNYFDKYSKFSSFIKRICIFDYFIYKEFND